MLFNNYEALSRNQVQRGQPVSEGQTQGILKRGFYGMFRLDVRGPLCFNANFRNTPVWSRSGTQHDKY
jgi:murein DD-endopeptidase MepM/ murein hydrolase activator NlpD